MFTAIIKKEKAMKNGLDGFIKNHPIIAFLLFFLGMPVFILVAVSICAIFTILPIAWLWGLL